mgnify:FL=1|tara:strand:+ start:4313 stop:4942 length:630 start_codon:yes stop_codon:yes gene_type:complete
MRINLLIFGTKNFNNSFDEIKEDLGFSLLYFDAKKFSESLVVSAAAVLVDSQICADNVILSLINKIVAKPILLLENQNSLIKCKYDEKVHLPITLLELQSKIVNLSTAYKFNKNSSIRIKNYNLDKNEKRLTKDSSFIIITEREVQLIELLFNANKPLSRSAILKNIWKYADDADTHTVETHIYRLRKKILNKFHDEKFIINSNKGYSL